MHVMIEAWHYKEIADIRKRKGDHDEHNMTIVLKLMTFDTRELLQVSRRPQESFVIQSEYQEWLSTTRNGGH